MVDHIGRSIPGRGRYWRSLDELAGDEQVFRAIEYEFPTEAAEWLDPLSRRNFLRIMGASLALAGVVGCGDFPAEKIVPYVNQPESVVPGKPIFYATTIPFCGHGIGALVESHEGRPTKIEGNPDHPASLGATNVFEQASVLDLYDPDRSRLVMRAGVAASWGAFQHALTAQLQTGHGKGDGVRILTRSITSPTFAAQLMEFRQQFPAARWHAYEPTFYAGCSARGGGAPGRAVYDFSKADVILSLDGNFLSSDTGSLAYARQFIDRRRRQPGLDPIKQKMNRLYVVESTLSLTGSMADHRRAVRPSEVADAARAIAGQLGIAPAENAAAPAGLRKFIDAVAADLKHAQSENRSGLVVAGDHLPVEIQALVHSMNVTLGAVGNSVRYIEPVDVQGAESLQALAADMAAGKVQTLLIIGGNPAYDAPADVNFADELQRLTTERGADGQAAHFTAHLGSHEDETSFLCHWHVPESHYLEMWGDLRAFDGTASIIQPLILPLSNASRSLWELMETLLGRPDRSGYEAVREHWQSQWKSVHGEQPATTQSAERTTAPIKDQRDARDFDQWWQAVLRKGVIDQSAFPAVGDDVAHPATEAVPAEPSAASAGNWQLTFRPDPGVWDGQYANNSWLQELPRPFTKLVWDNAAWISYRSAQQLGVTDGAMIQIRHDGRTLQAPVVIVPGLPDQTLTLHLGYGRTRAGNVGMGAGGTPRGFDAYQLLTSGMGTVVGAEVTAIPGKSAALVMTRNHHAMGVLPRFPAGHEEGDLRPGVVQHPGMSDQEIEIHNRHLVRSATLAEFRQDPDWVTKLGGEIEMRAKGISSDFPGRKISLSIYPANAADGGWDYTTGYQWGMSIDTSACIGCNACMIACQAENNIAVVGKDECRRQREMHWIRVDDWFGTQPGDSSADALDEPQIVHMPVPCQHCENAPCELVCPVGATTHSVEGLNEMTYNRCIGTRYCSNNCPYKVRRFNFLLFSDYDPTRALQYNPDVTVRSRGVMEKCTYCVQRLNRTRMEIEKTTLQLEERAAVVGRDSPPDADVLPAEITKRQRQMLEQLQTACQQACPTRAITFGNKNDASGEVARAKADKLDYTLLADLTTLPRTSYMARLRNPNPDLVPSSGTRQEG